jgi:hypothetical protein
MNEAVRAQISAALLEQVNQFRFALRPYSVGNVIEWATALCASRG